MKKQTTLLLLILSLLFSKGFAQTVLLHVDRATDSIPSDNGPNKSTFTHAFISGGLLIGSDKPGSRIIYGPSSEFSIGARTKHKVGSVYSVGWDTRINFLAVKLSQKKGKRLPDTLLHKTGRIDFSSVRIGFYNRINFDPRRANTLGCYLDLGISGQYDFLVETITKDDLPDGSQTKNVTRGLPYIDHFGALLVARVGLGKLAFYGTWRLNNYLKSSYHYSELPVLTAGLELAIY